MSFLQTVLVVVPCQPRPGFETVLLGENCDPGPDGTRLRRLSFGPGEREPVPDLYGATFSHIADSEFMDWLASLDWYPVREQVMVIAHHEYSDGLPMVYRLTDDGWKDAL